MLLNFIIPVYNEEDNIPSLINEIRKNFIFKIIVVDDGSKDLTYLRTPEDENIIKLKNDKNMGKGYSVKKALDFVDADYICLLDGDVKGIMEEISKELINIEKYDCIIFTPPIKKGGFGVVRKFSRHVVKSRTGIDAPWCISGMRVIKADVLQDIKDNLDNRFGLEVSMTIELLNKNYKIKNIYVDFMHRITTKNLKGFYHRWRQFVDIFKYHRFSRK